MTSSGYALLFPGQGSQHPAMLDRLPKAAAVERLLDAAEGLTGLPLRQIAATGTDEELADTRAAQPLLYLADWAWGCAVEDACGRAALVAGHSLGEYAALAMAGVFSVEAGLELVVARSRLMAESAESVHGGMAAVLGLDSGLIAETIAAIDGVWVANDNTPAQTVISGTHPGIEAATQALAAAGARRVVPLRVAGPFHSPLMEGARQAFEVVLDAAQMQDATIPVIQNTEPSPATDVATVRARLAGQITAPVRWTDTMRAIVAEGISHSVEAGPGSVLAGLARSIEGLKVVSAEANGIDGLVQEVC